jgi:hypothetical protein
LSQIGLIPLDAFADHEVRLLVLFRSFEASVHCGIEKKDIDFFFFIYCVVATADPLEKLTVR